MFHYKFCSFVLCMTLFLTACSAAETSTATPTVVSEQTIDATLTDMISSVASSMPYSSQETVSAVSSTPSSVASSKEPSKPSSVVSSKPSATVSKPVSSKPAPTKKPDTNQTKIVTYTKQPTYASLQQEIYGLQEAYPDLISVESIGSSVQGRDLTMLKVGKGVAKACVVGGFHSREMITTSYLMRFIEESCAAYQTASGKWKGYDMQNLLDSYTLYIVPMVNPDGLEIIGGRDTIDRKVTYHVNPYTGRMLDMSDFKANANGVNLNKNFPLLWKQIKSKYPNTDVEGYKGSFAGSEPETKALMNLCNSNDFMWMTSFHVRGDCVYWSDKTNPKVGLSEKVVNQLRDQCGFYKCPTSDEVDGYGGGFENWFRQQFKRPGFCIELVSLETDVTPMDNTNNRYFDSTVRWSSTYKVLPIVMQYGYIRK